MNIGDKDLRETISKILHLYAFSIAMSSVDIKDISEMKIQKKDVASDLVYLHYRMVEKSSIVNSKMHSAKLFRTIYDDIKNEHKKKYDSTQH